MVCVFDANIGDGYNSRIGGSDGLGSLDLLEEQLVSIDDNLTVALRLDSNRKTTTGTVLLPL